MSVSPGSRNPLESLTGLFGGAGGSGNPIMEIMQQIFGPIMESFGISFNNGQIEFDGDGPLAGMFGRNRTGAPAAAPASTPATTPGAPAGP